MNRSPLRRSKEPKGALVRALLGALTVIAVAGAGGAAGYWYAQSDSLAGTLSKEAVAQLESMFGRERKALEAARKESQAQLDAFAGRIGAMQAEILRLNALGERLVEMADLDAEEFDFEHPPAVGGGPDDILSDRDVGVSELVEEMTAMVGFISDRKRKLEQLEQSIMEKNLKKHATPSGLPVRSGYITSKFGYRSHPIRKKVHFHTGVDFASKRGTPVLATADGIVVFSGWKSGYGRLVEIRHMDGLVTRYAHNQKNLVEQGEMVKKGQTVATLGSTGSSTGPHVHFEVRKGGEAVDPLNYVGAKTSKKSG